MADSTKLQHHPSPTKFYSHFLYKALLVTVFCVLLPIFPSQPPEFINQTLNTRGWEFLHLIFVGIAVSYGLFSRRNDEPEKENINNSHNSTKFDNAQSYVSRFLQVSSVFDDEGDAPPSKSDEISTVHTWSNQYRRNEPVVVVADQQRQRSGGSGVMEKPLLLPVRSLKSRVVDADSDGISRESSGVSANSVDLEENDVVLPSPIPWRSRSGRMELKQEPNSPLHSQSSSSMEKSEFSRTPKAQATRVLRSDSPISSPRKPPTEVQGKSAEDFVRKKNIFRPPPPPPPPPPPAHLLPKSKTMKPSRHEDITPQRSSTMPKSVRSSRIDELDEPSLKIDQKVNRDRVSFMPEPTFMEFPKEEKEETVEKLVLEAETEDEEEEDDDEIETKSFNSVTSGGEQSSLNDAGSDGVGPDVDKKADEFIAKFREQIRLQRIESIKRSSGQSNRKITR